MNPKNVSLLLISDSLRVIMGVITLSRVNAPKFNKIRVRLATMSQYFGTFEIELLNTM